MSLSRKAWAAASVVGIAGSLLMAASSPAAASGTLSVSGMCESYPTNKTVNLLCDAGARGGTTPYTFSWHAISNGVFYQTTSSFVHGSCSRNTWFTYSVTVTDATHNTTTYSGKVFCSGTPI